MGSPPAVPERRFLAGWADMDYNAHMGNTAYLDKVVDARVMMLAELGMPLEEFTRLRIAVVIMKDEIVYRREIGWMQEFTIDFALAGFASDASRFKVRNRIRRADGELSATVTSTGGFMDRGTRKLIVPPQAVIDAYRSLPRTEDYEELPSSIKVRAADSA